jgi:gamma-glutamyltranspeptidase/glutathione hydrolase
LREISAKGAAAFYQGSIADKIVAASQAHHGILSKKDFSDYYVEELAPIICHYKDYTIISAPPPSSGGIALCEMLNILEAYPIAKMGFHSPEAIHYMVEAMRFAFYDRNNKLGDPDFVKNDWQELISKKYAAQIRTFIQDNKATPSSALSKEAFAKEGMHTTHYSIIDKMGNAVAVTYTLNDFFGANVIAENTGFFLNNEMDDFTAKLGAPNLFGLVEGNKNNIQPGKRPLSSMVPTIITQNNKVIMVVGSPGGPRIITTTLETIVNVLDFGMDLQAAADAPRFHHQWLPDVIEIEPSAITPQVMQKLSTMGYQFSPKNRWGAVETIYIDPVSQKIYGANDFRRPAGAAIGN